MVLHRIKQEQAKNLSTGYGKEYARSEEIR